MSNDTIVKRLKPQIKDIQNIIKIDGNYITHKSKELYDNSFIIKIKNDSDDTHDFITEIKLSFSILGQSGKLEHVNNHYMTTYISQYLLDKKDESEQDKIIFIGQRTRLISASSNIRNLKNDLYEQKFLNLDYIVSAFEKHLF